MVFFFNKKSFTRKPTKAGGLRAIYSREASWLKKNVYFHLFHRQVDLFKTRKQREQYKKCSPNIQIMRRMKRFEKIQKNGGAVFMPGCALVSASHIGAGRRGGPTMAIDMTI